MASTVNFEQNQGPVVLEITSKFGCVGSFIVLAFENGDVVELFPDRPKLINDDIPDSLVLKFSLVKLEDIILSVVGKYAPAPGHNQIFIEYSFSQIDLPDANADLIPLKLETDGDVSNSILIQELSDSGIKVRNVFNFKRN